MFDKILIANRGEIACRIIKTARRLGIRTVAVYSSADRAALHARSADEAIAIGPAPSAQSYLVVERIVEAAVRSGAQAIHPGYGFLSENPALAMACMEAGIRFIGPGADAIRVMGSKAEAKALLAQHGVPLVPGYYDTDQTTARLVAAAHEVGLPLLIKASAGGGGRGMRIVRDFAEFEPALASAQREARSAFGDPSVLLERYVENPRHIEVQVFGDSHGNVVHLFERDCSLQRRHQKVIEEAPAVLLSEAQRTRLFDAAITAARAVDYVGAGTVEFIIDRSGEIFFIEMNTRLQVEHPVTECVTGIDLVEWQIRVAAGEALPLRQEAVTCHGHAIEVRVYAEDPVQEFRPSTGQLQHLQLPEPSASVRVDSGVVCGDTVTPFYDAMIAKIITHGDTRSAAIRQMSAALAATEVVGVTCNVGYLQRIVTHPSYLAGGYDTHLVEEARAALVPAPTAAPADLLVCAACHALEALRHRSASGRITSPAEHQTPWAELLGFRLNAPREFDFEFKDDHAGYRVLMRAVGNGWECRIGDETLLVEGYRIDGNGLHIDFATRAVTGTVIGCGDETHVFADGRHVRLRQIDRLHNTGDDVETANNLVAPMPGAVTSVLVDVGVKVTRGTPLLILEAMKIEHTISAPYDGTVREIHFRAGDQVTAEGIELISLEPLETASA